MELSADEVRERMAKLTSPHSVPDPTFIEKTNVVSSGSLTLDYGLVVGGFARGKFHSIEGPPGAGKTALAMLAIAAHQRLFPASVHALLDVEATADLGFFSKLGVDVDPNRFIVLRPESAEEACTMAMGLLGYEIKDKEWARNPKIKPVSSVVYDSWAGSPTAGIGLASLARAGSEWIPRIASAAARKDVESTIFWLNHIREKPGVSFGDPRYSPGGMALKHAQTTRLWVMAVNILKENNRRVGHDVKVDVQKNKLAPPFAKVYLHLNYASGFDLIFDAFSFLEARGVKFTEGDNGTTYTFKYATQEGHEEVKVRGREAFLDTLRGDPEAGEAFIETARLAAQESIAENLARSHAKPGASA